MKAIVRTPKTPDGFTIADLPRPTPAPDECLVKVHAAGVNFSDLPRNALYPEGQPIGFESAGIVETAAAVGAGPPTGARVACWRLGGAMAEWRCVRADEMCVLPDDIGFADAATLPEAGATALHAVRAMGAVLGRDVLITGASGGVGRFALQLAKLAGARRIVALVGSPTRGAGLHELGATEIVTSLDQPEGQFWSVLEGVGGRVFRDALHKVQDGGSLLVIGFRSWEPIVLAPRDDIWPALLATRRIRGVLMGAGEQVAPGETVSGDVAYLASLCASGVLRTSIDWRGPADRAGEAFELLDARQIAGKAVLTF